MNAIALPPTLELMLDLTDEQFWRLCENNRDFRFERAATGELIIMPPTGSETGRRNMDLSFQLQSWSRQNGLGIAFDSSTGFKLPNGANRSPDAAWIAKARWSALTAEQQEKFAPICPDFVVGLRSPSDNLENLQKKMREYIANGARLGWLLNRQNREVEIYRPNREVEIQRSPTALSGEDVLPDFILSLEQIL